MHRSPSMVAAFARRAMLLCVLTDLALIAVAINGADSPLGMPGGMAFVAKAALPLLAYGLISIRAPAIRLAHGHQALRTGANLGILGGVLQVAQLSLENFGSRIGENSTVTLSFMFACFLVWGFAGYLVARRTGDMKAGVVAGCWSAMVSVLVAVTFGLALMSANIPAPSYIATWSEFRESGWTDARAFGIANSLEAVLGHLVIGPIAGSLFGFLGAGMARLGRGRGRG